MLPSDAGTSGTAFATIDVRAQSGGGFLGAMLTRGIEKEVANFYDQAVAQGKLLVAVEIHGSNSERRLALAEQILAREGERPLPLPEG